MSRINPLYLSFSGLVFTLVGAVLSTASLQQALFLIGALFLLAASHLERHMLFYYLEVMVVACILSGYLPSSVTLGWVTPALIAASVLLWVYHKSLLNSSQNWLGAAGLAALGIGYATLTAEAYLVGGIILTIYSAGEIKNNSRIAWTFFILNLSFSVIAFLRVAKFIA